MLHYNIKFNKGGGFIFSKNGKKWRDEVVSTTNGNILDKAVIYMQSTTICPFI